MAAPHLARGFAPVQRLAVARERRPERGIERFHGRLVEDMAGPEAGPVDAEYGRKVRRTPPACMVGACRWNRAIVSAVRVISSGVSVPLSAMRSSRRD